MWGFAGLMPFPGWERVVGTREGVLATAPGHCLSGARFGPIWGSLRRFISATWPGWCVGWEEAAVPLSFRLDFGEHLGAVVRNLLLPISVCVMALSVCAETEVAGAQSGQDLRGSGLGAFSSLLGK